MKFEKFFIAQLQSEYDELIQNYLLECKCGSQDSRWALHLRARIQRGWTTLQSLSDDQINRQISLRTRRVDHRREE